MSEDRAIFSPENAHDFGRFFGESYRDKPIIWMLGGDQNIYTDGDREVIEAMALGLEDRDGGTHLITYHPRGPGLSSGTFRDVNWLDFDMFQSSHSAHDHDNGVFAEHDYSLDPPKPTIDGEARYETLPVGFYFRPNPARYKFDD